MSPHHGPRRLLFLALPLAAALQTPATGSDPADTARAEAFFQALSERAEATHAPAFALTVVHGGEVVLARGWGTADPVSGRPVGPATRFAIGSTTKAFTSTLAAMLVDDGALDWDDPIVVHLPEFRLQVRDAEPEDVLLRDLLAHRTGFTRMGAAWASGTASRAEVLAAATRAEAWAPFRERFLYDNVMYLAAGEAEARAAEAASWEALLQRRILDPLGMVRTTARRADVLADSDHAVGWLWDEDRGELRRIPMRNTEVVAPAGALWSTADDLGRWLRFLLAEGEWEGRRLVSAESLRETWRPQVRVGPVHYGLGWFVQDEDQGRFVVQHGGDVDGYSALVALAPDDGWGFALCVAASAAPMRNEAIGMAWGYLLGEPEGEEPARTEDPSEFVGEYDANFGPFRDQVFEVTVGDDGRLAVDVPGQTVYALGPPDEDGWRPFVLTDAIAVRFERDDSGRVVALHMRQAGLEFILPRRGVERPQPPYPDGWRGLTGRYALEARGLEFTVTAEGGRLLLDIPGETRYELLPPDEDGWWRLATVPAVRVRFLREGDAPPTALEFLRPGAQLRLTRVGDAPAAEDLPSWEEVRILMRTDARRAALRELGPLVLEGSIRFVHMGVAGTVREAWRPDGRLQRSTDLGPFGWSEEETDPVSRSAHTVSTLEPSEVLAGKRLRQALGLAAPNLLTDLAGWDVSVDRADEHDGRPCWVLRLAMPEVPDHFLWVDQQTGDPLRLDLVVLSPTLGGALPATTTFGDWREVGPGLRVPFLVATENDASGRMELRVEEARLPLADG